MRGRMWSGFIGVLLVLSLGGCSSEDGNDSKEDCPVSKEGCYNTPQIGALYCLVQQTRTLLVTNQVRQDDLPSWTLSNVREGAPVVVNFRKPLPASSDELVADLRASLERQGVAVPGGNIAVAGCTESLTHEQVAATEGGPPEG